MNEHLIQRTKVMVRSQYTTQEITAALQDLNPRLFDALYKIPRQNILNFLEFAFTTYEIEQPFIDVGCGDQRYITQLLQKIGLNQTPTGIDHLKQTAQKKNFIQGTALELPFRDASIKTIVSSEVLEHVPDDHAVIAEFSRILVPNGLLIMTIPGRDIPKHEKLPYQVDYRRYTQAHILRMMKNDFVINNIQSIGVDELESNIFVIAHKQL